MNKFLQPLLNKAIENYKVIINLIILILTILGTTFAWQSLNLQENIEEKLNYPFFHYDYSNGIFRVFGDERVGITKVDWFFLSKANSDDGQFHLRPVGHLPTDLSYGDIRDFFAFEMGVNPDSQKK